MSGIHFTSQICVITFTPLKSGQVLGLSRTWVWCYKNPTFTTMHVV